MNLLVIPSRLSQLLKSFPCDMPDSTLFLQPVWCLYADHEGGYSQKEHVTADFCQAGH